MKAIAGPVVRIVAALVVLGVAQGGALFAQQEISIGRRYTLQSEVLGEARSVRVHLPPGYDDTARSYLTLYITDAEAHFAHVSATADFLAMRGLIPPFIVVGIENTVRDRDLTPTRGWIGEGEKKFEVPRGGGAAKFTAFITRELFPWVEKNYRVTNYRAFMGHSFGGLFAMTLLTSHPDAFQALIAVSPTMNWEGDWVMDRARPFFAAKKEANHALFVAMGHEPPLAAGFAELERVMSASKAEGFIGAAKKYPQDDHSTLVLAAVHDGLRALFADWMLQRDLDTGLPRETAREIREHYAKLSKRVGHEVQPPEVMVNLAGYGRLREKRLPEAIEIFEMNAELYPKSANVWDSLAEALEAAGKRDEARALVEKAVALAEKNKDPLLPAFQKHLEALGEKSDKNK